jgi:hypothetical protein
MQIKRKSVISGIVRELNIPVNPDDYAAWQAGHGNIQDMMPYLNERDREFILSGITKDEWNSAFQELHDDEAAI